MVRFATGITARDLMAVANMLDQAKLYLWMFVAVVKNVSEAYCRDRAG
ncbi:hypothetical protein LX24_00499 [Desulfallas thermosapovorans DSM 6562]|uniref:Uncharacterized protein n=1 Tax=Desulfallas thermosapovorans DSM 6562 TaxID=1121431 RepID=A0A5S4ZWB3_9FIRM|nr:hypothetical protein LX24_00499 [Desulfallas thermosapovorans DSM 6562]